MPASHPQQLLTTHKSKDPYTQSAKSTCSSVFPKFSGPIDLSESLQDLAERISAMRNNLIDYVDVAIGTLSTFLTNKEQSATMEESRMNELNHTVEPREEGKTRGSKRGSSAHLPSFDALESYLSLKMSWVQEQLHNNRTQQPE